MSKNIFVSKPKTTLKSMSFYLKTNICTKTGNISIIDTNTMFVPSQDHQ